MTEIAPGREQQKQPEQEAVLLSQAVVHASMTAVEHRFADPAVRTVSDEQKATWVTKTPDALKPAWEAADAVSWDRRCAAEAGDTRDFDVRNKEWNQEVHTALQEFFTDRSASVNVLGLRKITLNAVGLVENETGTNDHGLYLQVEAFRQKYVSETKSNMRQFYADIATSCKRGDGTIDMDELQKRLNAVKSFLGVFGEERNAGKLAADLGMAEAMLTQKEDTKRQLSDAMQSQIQQPPSHEERVRLEALHEKLQGQQQPAAPEVPIPPEPPPASDPAIVAAHARGRLGRELTDDEKSIIQNGGDIRDVLAEARKDPVNQYKQLRPITMQEYMDEHTPDEKRTEAMVILPSLAAVARVLEYGDDVNNKTVENSEERKKDITTLKAYADTVKKYGGEPIFVVSAIKDATGQIIPVPAWQILRYPDGVDKEAFAQKVLDEVQYGINEAEENHTPQEEVVDKRGEKPSRMGEHTDASEAPADNSPLTDDELDFALKYMSYSDVLQEPREESEKYYANHPRARMYVRELQQIFAEYGESVVKDKAQNQVKRLSTKLKALGILGSPFGRNQSWYMWHSAKSHLLAHHPDIQASLPNAEKYKPFDPLLQYKRGVSDDDRERAIVAENELLNTQLGWEVVGHLKRNSRTPEDIIGKLPANMDEADRNRLQVLLSEKTKDAAHLLPAYKLRQIGQIISKYSEK